MLHRTCSVRILFVPAMAEATQAAPQPVPELVLTPELGIAYASILLMALIPIVWGSHLSVNRKKPVRNFKPIPHPNNQVTTHTLLMIESSHSCQKFAVDRPVESPKNCVLIPQPPLLNFGNLSHFRVI
jgi:hypothetical protein